jgi:hypothetical protein
MTSTPFFASVDLLHAIDLCQQYSHSLGLLIAAAGFVNWHGRKSEIRLSERIGRLELEFYETLGPL